MRVFLTIVWLLCCGYATIPSFWFAAHPFASFWRKQRRSPYYALLPIWGAIIAATAVITWHWHNQRLYASPWTWLAALPLLGAGFRLYSLAHRGFTHSQLAGRPELERTPNEQRLVTSGIRGRLRHPIYLGHLLEMIGWAVGTGLMVIWLLTGFAIVTGAFMIRMEERELESRFGVQYREYRAQVPAIIPTLRHKLTSASHIPESSNVLPTTEDRRPKT